jgi:hypothetical protein
MSLLLPVSLLVASILSSPHLFTVNGSQQDIKALPDYPVLLYRRNSLAVYYTSSDLLHPERFGKPGQFYQAVVFDVWPANEGHSTSVTSLTWIHQIRLAFDLQDASGNPLPDAQATDADNQVAKDFLHTFIGPPKLERGKVLTFPIPSESTYGKMTGLKSLIAMAIKDPGDKNLFPHLKGTPSLLSQSIAEAFKQGGERKLTGLGIPFMPTSAELGQTAPQTTSWKIIFDEIDSRANSNGIAIVVLGGWGVLPENREQTDRAFRQAWAEWHNKLGDDQRRPVHEQIRLTGLIALAALIGGWRRKKLFTVSRLIAVLVIAATLGITVVSLFNWVQPLMPSLILGTASLVVKAILAVIAGAFIDKIVGFEPKKELQTEPGG